MNKVRGIVIYKGQMHYDDFICSLTDYQCSLLVSRNHLFRSFDTCYHYWHKTSDSYNSALFHMLKSLILIDHQLLVLPNNIFDNIVDCNAILSFLSPYNKSTRAKGV